MQLSLFDTIEIHEAADERIRAGILAGFGGLLPHELVVDLFAGGGGL